MPTNLYGPNDNFDLQSGHVLPAMIRKFHEAKEAGDQSVVIWGTGNPMREFLHVDDLADACLFLMENFDNAEHINIGTGQDLTIRSLAELVGSIVYPDGKFIFDTSKPDGMPRKVLDVSRVQSMGWRPTISLSDGIRSTYEWFLNQPGVLDGVIPGLF
jgi:GDP-L-fucose synthase